LSQNIQKKYLSTFFKGEFTFGSTFFKGEFTFGSTFFKGGKGGFF
jgi:hypothetical protein